MAIIATLLLTTFQLLNMPTTVSPDFTLPEDVSQLISGKIDPSTSSPLHDKIRAAAAKYGVPEDLAIRWVNKENPHWDPNAVSGAGAIGLLQIMPNTAKALGIDPHDVDQNIDGAFRYLTGHYKEFKRWDLALAAYNAGPTAVRNGRWQSFPETSDYVRTIWGGRGNRQAGPSGSPISPDIDKLISQTIQPTTPPKPQRQPVGAVEIPDKPHDALDAAELAIGRVVDKTPILSHAVDVSNKVMATKLPQWMTGLLEFAEPVNPQTGAQEGPSTIGEAINRAPIVGPGVPGGLGELGPARAARPTTVAATAPVAARTEAEVRPPAGIMPPAAVPGPQVAQRTAPPLLGQKPTVTQGEQAVQTYGVRPPLAHPFESPTDIARRQTEELYGLRGPRSTSLHSQTMPELRAAERADQARSLVPRNAPPTATSVTGDLYDTVRGLLNNETGSINLTALFGELNKADQSLRKIAGELSDQVNMFLTRATEIRTVGRHILNIPEIVSMREAPIEMQRALRSFVEDRTKPIDPGWRDIISQGLDPVLQDLRATTTALAGKLTREQYAQAELDQPWVPRLAAQYGSKAARRSVFAQMASSEKPYSWYTAVNAETGEERVISVGDAGVQWWDRGESKGMGNFDRRPKVGETFTDKEGNNWDIRQATADAVEANSNQRYHTNVPETVVLKWMEAKQVHLAVEFMDNLKANEEFLANAVDSGKVPPAQINPAWVTTSLPQFRGWRMEPKLAAILNQYDRGMQFRDYNLLQRANMRVVNTLFWIPTVHAPNLATMIWTSAVSHLDQSARMVFETPSVIKDIMQETPRFRAYMNQGYRSMFSEARNREFWDSMFRSMDKAMMDNPALAQKLAEAWHTNVETFRNWGPNFLARNLSWIMDDLTRMSEVRALERNGYTAKNAVTEAHRFMVDYRQPAYVDLGVFGDAMNKLGNVMAGAKGARAGDWMGIGLGRMLSDSGLFMFQAWHTGLLRSLRNMTLTPGTNPAQVMLAARRLAAVAFGYFVVLPFADKAVQSMTGNPRSGVRRTAGIFGPLEHARRVLEGEEDVSQAAMAFFTPQPAYQLGAALMTRTDPYTKQPIYGAGAPWNEVLYGTAGEAGRLLGPISDISRSSRQGLAGDVGSKVGLTMGSKLTPAEAAFLITGKQRAQDVTKRLRTMDPASAQEFYRRELSTLVWRAKHMLVDEAGRGIEGVPSDPTEQETLANILARKMLQPPTGQFMPPQNAGGLPWRP